MRKFNLDEFAKDAMRRRFEEIEASYQKEQET